MKRLCRSCSIFMTPRSKAATRHKRSLMYHATGWSNFAKSAGYSTLCVLPGHLLCHRRESSKIPSGLKGRRVASQATRPAECLTVLPSVRPQRKCCVTRHEKFAARKNLVKQFHGRDGTFHRRCTSDHGKNVTGKGELYRVEDVMLSGGVPVAGAVYDDQPFFLCESFKRLVM